jgi:hypothetical protein
MKVNITANQYNNLIISEAENVAYNRNNANEPNLKAIWDAIDRKQKILQDEVFGELSEKIYDITVEKAKSMGEEFMEVPKNICNAGNDKLPSSVLIINMSSSLMCPSYYLGICTITNGACYAQRAENQYSAKDKSSVLTNRWKTDLMHTQMLQQYQHGNKKPMKDYFNLIETYIQLGNAYSENLYKKEYQKMQMRLGRELTPEEKNFLRIQQSENKITDIRINETGDFQCQLAVNLWGKFADKIKKKYGINTHAYTARNLDFSNVSKSMAINPSHEGINLGNAEPRMFKAVGDKFYNNLEGGDQVKNRQPVLGVANGKYFYKCPCSRGETHCDMCGVCFDKNKTGKPYTIYVKYHGLVAANGFKNLFKKDEVENVIEKLHENGWITEEEYQSYISPKNQNFLDNISKKIDKQRKQKKAKK